MLKKTLPSWRLDNYQKIIIQVQRDGLGFRLERHLLRLGDTRQVDDGRGRQGVAQWVLVFRFLGPHLERKRLQLLQPADDARVGVLAIVFLLLLLARGSCLTAGLPR
jgi:hypothetical protein